MPHIARTVLPRIRKSIAERGLAVTLARSVLLPWHLLREYRSARQLHRHKLVSEFDAAHGVDTEGDYEGWTYLSDLKIASPNWIYGNNYAAIEPERFAALMASVEVPHEDFTFIDFGSGKGRALLLAAEYPFRQIVGLEFSPELNQAAVENVARFRSARQKCRAITPLCRDFTSYRLPATPLFLFFFDPAEASVLGQVMADLARSLEEHPRQVYVAYVGPREKNAFVDASFLQVVARNPEQQFVVYRSR